MQKPTIHKLAVGVCNCYLVKEKGLILVDVGPHKKCELFLKKLKELSIDLKDFNLIFLTHGHWDHIGAINRLKELTGCKVAINNHEKDCVEKSINPPAPGVGLWGKVSAAILDLFESSIKFPGTSVDLMLEDKDLSLESYGISGTLLYTPGHTIGSMSLLLNTGDAFVGDLAMNGLPLRIGPGFPIYAVDIEAVKKSVKLLLERGAKRIYPSHGDSFKAELLKKYL